MLENLQHNQIPKTEEPVRENLWPAHSSKPWPYRIKEYAEVAGLPEEELASITGFSLNELKHFMETSEGSVPEMEKDSRAATLYDMLRIFRYIITLSNGGREPSYYWSAVDGHKGDSAVPPWDTIGLKSYLLEQKQDGALKASEWLGQNF